MVFTHVCKFARIYRNIILTCTVPQVNYHFIHNIFSVLNRNISFKEIVMFPSILAVCHLFTTVEIIDISKSIMLTSNESTIHLFTAFYTPRSVCIPVDSLTQSLDPSVCTHAKIRTPANRFSLNFVRKNVTKKCRVI
jgi:hypothetical protein